MGASKRDYTDKMIQRAEILGKLQGLIDDYGEDRIYKELEALQEKLLNE